MTIILDTFGSNKVFTGTRFFDTMRGLDGNDWLIGRWGNDILDGGLGDDRLYGNRDQDILIGSSGNDYFDGGSGFDTADYSKLGKAITLSAVGEVQKGSLGIDKLKNIEKIVADASQIDENLIDGTTGAFGNAAFNIDLALNQLRINLVNGSVFEFEVENFKNVKGTVKDDVIRGDAQSNTFYASGGSDTYSGGIGGNDVLDYSSFNSAITLESGGLIIKEETGEVDRFEFGPGPNLVQTIDTIKANTSKINTINGSLRTPGANGAKINVNLEEEILQVVFADKLEFGDVGIVPGDELKFEVTGFTNVRGGSNDDNIKGNAADNTFFGSVGDDKYDGSGGTNTLDYSVLGAELGEEVIVTLGVAGSITKQGSTSGDLGTDRMGIFSDFASGQLAPVTPPTIQTIIGQVDQANAIDGTGGVSGVSFAVDLEAETLTVNGLPGAPTFNVVNFVNVIGTVDGDTITGNDEDNLLDGQGGNDVLIGGDGNDDLRGGLGGDTLVGVKEFTTGLTGEVDTLTGGEGGDSFFLGDELGNVYYSQDQASRALIQDFQTGVDKLIMFGSVSDYTFKLNENDFFDEIAFNDTGNTIAIFENNKLAQISDISFV